MAYRDTLDVKISVTTLNKDLEGLSKARQKQLKSKRE